MRYFGGNNDKNVGEMMKMVGNLMLIPIVMLSLNVLLYELSFYKGFLRVKIWFTEKFIMVF